MYDLLITSRSHFLSCRCQELTVEYLLTQLDTSSQLKRIDAFELLGASFANDKDNYDIIKAFSYLEKGMAERWSNSESGPILKPSVTLTPNHSAYDNHVECASPEDLGKLLDRLYGYSQNLPFKDRIYFKIIITVIHNYTFRIDSRISKQDPYGGFGY